MTSLFVEAYLAWQGAAQAKAAADVDERHRTQEGYDRWEKAMRLEASTRRSFQEATVRLAQRLSGAAPLRSVDR